MADTTATTGTGAADAPLANGGAKGVTHIAHDQETANGGTNGVGHPLHTSEKTNGGLNGVEHPSYDPEKATEKGGAVHSKHDNGAIRISSAGDAVDERSHRIGRLAAVPIEDLIFHANHQRMSYGMHNGPDGIGQRGWFRFFDNPFGPRTADNLLLADAATTTRDSKQVEWEKASREDLWPHFAQEKLAARRALRAASWAQVFFLATTDVIGPFNAPYAFSTLGFAGGICIYFAFGLAALFSSFYILNLYLRLDSDRHPIQNYGELVEVFLGTYGHYTVAVIQVVQIIFIAATNIIACAQSMTLLTSPNDNSVPICFIGAIVLWAGIGWLISVPFKSLKLLSYLCSADVFINLTVLFVSMGFIAHSAPNYVSAAATYGYDINPPAPIMTGAVGSGDLATQVNGAANAIFAWSGLMIFVEFLNEMRRPYDFFKSFCAMEALVLVVYVMYGGYVYGLHGQYTLPVAFQGVSKYSWASVGNGLSLWTYTMASVLYLNIGVKVAYWLIFQDLFDGPPINSKKGWVLWGILQTIAWILAFIIGTAIPQVQTLQALIGAALLLQFSYTLPPLMQFLFDVQADASREDGLYVPGEPPKRKDTWRQMSRIKRGLFTGRVWFKSMNLAYVLAGLALCGLGIWGSVETIIVTFEESAATSFGCTAPV